MLDRGLQVVKRCAVYYTARLRLARQPGLDAISRTIGERPVKTARVV